MSSKKVWWKCISNPAHEWQAQISNRAGNKSGCPFCAGKKVDVHNCLQSTHPELALEWDFKKNAPLTPADVTRGSKKEIHWVCRKNKTHKWCVSVNSRTSTKSGCPYCSGRLVTPATSLKALYPKLAREWHKSNGELTPAEVFPTSGLRVFWQCKVHKSHVWDAAIDNRTRGQGCPFCSGNRVCGTNSLANNKRSLVKEWHPTRNGALMPKDVHVGSNKKVWWICKKSHEWEAEVYRRVKGSRCPFCINRRAN